MAIIYRWTNIYFICNFLLKKRDNTTFMMYVQTLHTRMFGSKIAYLN